MSSSARGSGRWAAAVLLLLARPIAAQEAGAVPDAAQAPPPAAPLVYPPPSEPPRPVSGSAAPSIPPASEAPRPVTVAPLPSVASPPPPEAHQHVGLFFHADIGAGYLRTSGSKAGSPFVGEGAAVGFAVAIGWAPDEEWAFALEGWAWKALSPSGLGANTSVELDAIGLNVTRYIVPLEIFVTAVVSGTRLAITDSSDSPEYAHSDIGFGLKVMLGKEWKVSSSVGLGVAGQLFLAVNRNEGASLDTLGGGLVFSVTFR